MIYSPINLSQNGLFVVEQHLRFERRSLGGGRACFEQAVGFQQRVGVALQPAGVP
jgi:hypothetical protein